MTSTALPEQHPWPLWRKIIFRFFFILISFLITPWTWLDRISGINKVTTFFTDYYQQAMNWAVEKSNANFFHVRKVLVAPNGSGDTSYAWAQLWMLLSLALIGCVIWSIADRKRNNYRHLNYWLCIFARYYIAMMAFSYGIIKIFAGQMPFPSETMMATPLGDLLPMRLSWAFIGYSTPYQVFSGVMEFTTGLLLLHRRTATLGILVGTAVFTNVLALNLSYDIPVKLFSMQLLLLCLYLLANEFKRIACFLVLNKPAGLCYLYQYDYPRKWMRITRMMLKIAFVGCFVGYIFYDFYGYSKMFFDAKEIKPIRPGIYEVPVFVRNHDTIPNLVSDTLRWQDIIFAKGGRGSIKTGDTAFRHIYGRASFNYKIDSADQLLSFTKAEYDTQNILSLHYLLPDSNTIRLWGMQGNDSLYIELKRSRRHFQLAEKQFHWLSEYNR